MSEGNLSSPQNQNNLKSPQQRKPAFYYGYIVVLTSFLMTMFGWGLFYTYGVFFSPLEKSFGWSRALTSGAFSISILASGLCGIAAGRLSDRFGPRIVIIICTILLATGYPLISLVRDAWQFYLLYGVLVAAGVGGFWAPPVAAVARWFVDKRGLMTGIVSGGISFGTLMLPPVLTQVITIFDWRLTYLILSLAVLVVMSMAIIFFKNSPSLTRQTHHMAISRKTGVIETQQGYSLIKALRTRQFWMVCAVYFGFGLVQLTVMVHIVPYASGLGISLVSAAGILSIIGGTSLIARIIVGMIADRLRTKVSSLLCLGLLTVSVVWLLFSDNLWKSYLFAIVFGFGYGGLSCLQSLIAAELYGLTALGVITAIFSFSFDLGGAAGPVIAGYIYDIQRSYEWAFVACGMVIFGALVIAVSLNPPKKEN